MPEHRRGSREDAAEVRDVVHADERRCVALEEVEGEHRDGQAAAVRPPDVRRADRAAAVLADVLVAEGAHEPVPPRARPDEVARDDDEREGHRTIPYCSTQPSTTP